jgi:hypothetical protein
MADPFDKAFRGDGYAVLPFRSAVPRERIRARILSVFEAVTRANGIPGVADDRAVDALYRGADRDLWVATLDQLRFLPEVTGMASDPSLLAVASRCGIRLPAVGSRGTALLANMPNDDAYLYGAHQDISFNAGSLNSITIWIPLQNCPAEQGPLEVVPRSHRRGLVPYDGNPNVKQTELLDPVPESEFRAVPLDTGQAIVFNKFLIHRAGRNRSETIRFSLQVRYNDLASPEYGRRKLTFDRLDPDGSYEYSIDA